MVSAAGVVFSSAEVEVEVEAEVKVKVVERDGIASLFRPPPANWRLGVVDLATVPGGIHRLEALSVAAVDE